MKSEAALPSGTNPIILDSSLIIIVGEPPTRPPVEFNYMRLFYAFGT